VDVNIPGDPATEPDRAKLNRSILLSNLIAGPVWLLPLFVLLAHWSMLLVVTMYVVAGSVFLAAVYAHEVVTRRQEALAWIGSWLVSVALWFFMGIGLSGENTVWGYLLCLFDALLVATPCYLAWQMVALAVRQLMLWRSGRSAPTA
jgi:hypothetical protein